MGTTARQLSLLITLSYILTLSPAWARDGNELLEMCRAGEKQNPKMVDILQNGYCSGVVDGVAKTLSSFRELLPQDLKVCLPDGVTSGQNVKVVIKYLRDNPSELHLPEIVLIQMAVLKAFPCK